jgi:septal ring factor EnvC (AmiA/AmiB activator)
MFAVSVVVFVTGLLGLICLLVIGRPMMRASERQYKLAESRAALKKLRDDRGDFQSQLAELESQRAEQAKNVDGMRAELKDLATKIGKAPKQVHELTFELGTPDGGMQAFDFVLSRQAAYLDLEKISGPERALWKQPRVLRVWSRGQASAVTTAEKRYPVQNGFIVRTAERIAAGDQRAQG